jgi:hypothetical protein
MFAELLTMLGWFTLLKKDRNSMPKGTIERLDKLIEILEEKKRKMSK